MLGSSDPGDIAQATALLGEILKVLGTAFLEHAINELNNSQE